MLSVGVKKLSRSRWMTDIFSVRAGLIKRGRCYCTVGQPVLRIQVQYCHPCVNWAPCRNMVQKEGGRVDTHYRRGSGIGSLLAAFEALRFYSRLSKGSWTGRKPINPSVYIPRSTAAKKALEGQQMLWSLSCLVSIHLGSDVTASCLSQEVHTVQRQCWHLSRKKF